ncbi:hypothetical protein HYALB_00007816 [Hymenoscyphus albidus]|uniref:Uncharacterized protein n=1 Tax=Hymenoscyphus albidus TaxID=595503 RepID=A0A9N9LB10_9HELO|nr:hypothetical protein HYALB_00007816 [Hymenoscyphus albidus]
MSPRDFSSPNARIPTTRFDQDYEISLPHSRTIPNTCCRNLKAYSIMSKKQSLLEFQFVNSALDSPMPPRDLAVRTLIRKQAMKKAAATRKKNGNYGKHNLRQYPVFVELMQPDAVELIDELAILPESTHEKSTMLRNADEPNSSKEQIGVAKKKPYRPSADSEMYLVILALGQGLPGTLSAKGYELSSIKSDFDILDLSSLASMYAVRAARAALSNDPQHLIDNIRARQQWSYLSYLPKLSGHYPCLNAATDCVVARARQLVSPHEDWESTVIGFHVSALEALQKALDDPRQRYTPEVLCATEILSLYELLDPLGPSNYTSDFEKALFLAHTGAIMTECLLNNERCFLEEKRWQKVFHSLIVRDGFQISDRSEITITLIMLKAFLPGFYHDATNIIYADALPEVDTVDDLISGVRRILNKLYEWHDRYVTVLSYYPKLNPGSVEYDSACKVFSTYLTCIMAGSRLLGIFSPNERASFEERTQEAAAEVNELDLEVRSVSKHTCVFLAQSRGTAQSIIATREEWQQFIAEEPDLFVTSGRLLVRSHLRSWWSTIGRKMPRESNSSEFSC